MGGMVRAASCLVLAVLAGCGSGPAPGSPDGGVGSDGAGDVGAGIGHWETLPPMPDPPRFYLGAAALGNSIYVIGGDAGPNAAVVQAFDAKAATWQTLPSLPTQFTMPSVATVGDRLFLLGALRTTTTLEFDGQGQWLARAPMPLAGGRGAAAVGVWNGKVVIAGGILPGQSNNGLNTGIRQPDAVAYDTASDTWQMLAPLPVAVAYSMAAVVGDKFWVIGGSTNDERTDAVHVLDLPSNTWSDAPVIDRSLSSAAAASIGVRIYMMGGIATSVGMVSPETFLFDRTTSALTPLAPMITPRFAGAAAMLAGRLYVVGGLVQASASDTHAVTAFEAFTP
jgi:N-acetylneuraminic acid mutarotase